MDKGLKGGSYYLGLIQTRTAFQTFPEDHVFEYLTRLSDGAVDMDVDGSAAVQNFDYVVPAGTQYKQFSAVRINFGLVDGAIRWGQFGGLGSALGNGLLIQALHEDGTVLQDFGTTANPITTNENFANLAGVDNIIVPAAGDDAIPIRWTIERSGNKMTLLPNWRFRIVVRDNLTGLSFFRAMIQGVLKV